MFNGIFKFIITYIKLLFLNIEYFIYSIFLCYKPKLNNFIYDLFNFSLSNKLKIIP